MDYINGRARSAQIERLVASFGEPQRAIIEELYDATTARLSVDCRPKLRGYIPLLAHSQTDRELRSRIDQNRT